MPLKVLVPLLSIPRMFPKLVSATTNFESCAPALSSSAPPVNAIAEACRKKSRRFMPDNTIERVGIMVRPPRAILSFRSLAGWAVPAVSAPRYYGLFNLRVHFAADEDSPIGDIEPQQKHDHAVQRTITAGVAIDVIEIDPGSGNGGDPQDDRAESARRT